MRSQADAAEVDTLARDQAFYSRYDQCDSIDLLRAVYHRHSFVPHCHDTFAIGVIEAGATVTYFQGSNYIVPAGAVLSLNPGDVHTGSPHSAADGWHYRMLYPTAGLVCRIASARAGRQIAEVVLEAPSFVDSEIAELVRRLHAVLESGGSLLESQSLLYETLGLIIERHGRVGIGSVRVGNEPAAVARIKEYLAAHLAPGVRLSDIASLVALSPFHVIRLFRRHTGLPPYAYFEQLRVERAMQLLGAGTPVAEVVAATGFSDQSHLARRFKRIVGVPPGKYARSVSFRGPAAASSS